ncbi:hypothetical protein Acr_06g0000200 [Actinidia rufa]|uniref:Uncharacterized protein n=1 Tax=Actinidia rufa TaxID=165716 RepID=A0A7J0EP62_9ERIC|nr:hypothetical protein Acr_06g0000200 [Actinidia rufa]
MSSCRCLAFSCSVRDWWDLIAFADDSDPPETAVVFPDRGLGLDTKEQYGVLQVRVSTSTAFYWRSCRCHPHHRAGRCPSSSSEKERGGDL